MTKEEIKEKLLRNIKVKDEHWLWIGPYDTVSGYGYTTIDKKLIRVHRLSAFVYLDLDISNRYELALHKQNCEIKRCINPEHLYVGTDADNAMDRTVLGHTKGGARINNSFCRNGHPRTKENTRKVVTIHGQVTQVCRICVAENARRYRAIG